MTIIPKNTSALLLILGCLLLTAADDAQGFPHPGGLHSAGQIHDTRDLIESGDPVRKAAYAELLKQARENLKRKPHQSRTASSSFFRMASSVGDYETNRVQIFARCGQTSRTLIAPPALSA